VVDPKICLVTADTKSLCSHHPPSPTGLARPRALEGAAWACWRAGGGAGRGAGGAAPGTVPRPERAAQPCLQSKQRNHACLTACVLSEARSAWQQPTAATSACSSPAFFSHPPAPFRFFPWASRRGLAAWPPCFLSSHSSPPCILFRRALPRIGHCTQFGSTHQHAPGCQWEDAERRHGGKGAGHGVRTG
jgi:hypothetical protein